jgi:DNA polymerase III subunit gamma/tau
MSYLVLARKWRPKTFADLVGQEHVSQTLRNAIAQGRIAHAFLFTGARGVGKTTIARIMARSLNCLTRTDASSEPCLECAACNEIALGTDPDVQEIDGASNNGVDDVRKLQETLPYRPQRDRYKVVIIDEVHMLTTGAWNALLKTLEEPPAHVKFIFATTEVHKVIPTILSRVQRYDFRLIPTVKIRERIAYILREEGFRFDDAAVALVAREAAGSLRDALSQLDQVIAGVQGEITGAAAARLLGVADRKVLYELGRAMLAGDAPKALRALDAMANEGYDLNNLARSMLSVLRDLVVAKTVSDPSDLLDLADEERAEVVEIARTSDVLDLERLFVAWAKTTEEVARAREPRWVLEMAAVRLSHRPTLLPVDELMNRLVDLERRLSSGSPPPPSSGGASPPRGGGSPPAGASRPPVQGAPAVQSSVPGSAAPQRFTAPRVPDVPRAQSDGTVGVAVARSVVAPAVVASPVSWIDQQREKAREVDARTQPKTDATVTRTSVAPGAAVPVNLVDTSRAASVIDAWKMIVEAADGGMVPVLKGAVPLEISAEFVRIAIDERDSFFRRKLATPESYEIIALAASKVYGMRPTVELVQGTLPEGSLSIARAEENARNEERREREETLRANPLVTLVCEVLGGEITRVRLDGDLV